MTLPNGQQGSFKCDANRIRFAKSDSTGSLGHLIDPLMHEILAEYDAGTGLRLWQFSATDAQLQKTIAYGYDAAGNRTRLSYDGLSTAYGYDPANRLSALTDPDGETSYLTYDPGGRRASLAQGNGVVTSYGYDAANRTLSIGRPGALPSFAYSYDLNGNPLTKSYTGGTQDQYFYDPANRLIAYTGPSGVRAQYGYTGSGDLQVIEGLSSTGAPTFETSFQENAFDQVTQFQPGHALITYGYDANGNRTGQTSQDQSVYPYPPQQVTSYSWTDDDRLGSVTLPNGQLDAFKYDANGIRVGKSDSTGSVRCLIDPLTQAILATYDAGTGLRLAQYNQNPQKLDEVFSVKSAQGTKLYPHTDMLGSVYAVSDSTGTSQATWSYDVYGTRTQTSGTLAYAFGFTGREHDQDTGLISSRQRYYDPSVGSWLSKDRIGYKSGPNLYQYVLDNPTLYSDPLGEEVLGSGPNGEVQFEGLNAAGVLGVLAILGLVAVAMISGGTVPAAAVAGAGAAGATGGLCAENPELQNLAEATGNSVEGLLNTVNHIFADPGHNLGDFLSSFGDSTTDAYQALLDAVSNQSLADGFYRLPVNVNGSLMTIAVYVSNGVIRVTDAWIP